jgi:ParB family chromosome partitioning protein
MSEAEESRLTALREEADSLENEWSDADEIPDDVETRITAIDEEIAALLARPPTFDPEEQARGGAFVSIDLDGSLHVDRGYVRAEDEAVGDADPDDDDDGLDGGDESGAEPGGATVVSGMPGVDAATDDEEQDDLLRPIPDRLVSELTAYRTMALRDALASSPQVAFAAVLHAFVLDTFYSYSSDATCLQVSIRSPYLGSHAPKLGDFGPAKAVDARHESWSERLPDQPADLWDVLTALDADDQAALFAHCASLGVNALWEAATRYNSVSVSARTVSNRIGHSHVLARVTGLDMVAAGWTPKVDNYLGRVTKPHILAAVEQAKGAEAADRLAGLKKPDMARAAKDVLVGTGWLAEPLRTPDIDVPDTDGGVTAIDPETFPGEDTFDEAYAVAAE